MQSRIDSVMEVLTNTAIGLVISTIATRLILVGILGLTISLGANLFIGSAFTVISIVRSYAIRRAFNGKTVWSSIKAPLLAAVKRFGVRAAIILGVPFIAVAWLLAVPFNFIGYFERRDHIEFITRSFGPKGLRELRSILAKGSLG